MLVPEEQRVKRQFWSVFVVIAAVGVLLIFFLMLLIAMLYFPP